MQNFGIKLNIIPKQQMPKKITYESNLNDDLPLNKITKLHNLTKLLGLYLKKMVNIIHKFS